MKYDVVIVGSGIAGLFTALRCSQRGLSVLVVTKSRIKSSSTNWAQGGIAAVLDPADEMAIEAHVQDTISSGKGYAMSRSEVSCCRSRTKDCRLGELRSEIRR